MAVVLTPEQERIVEQHIASGRYATPAEVVSDALAQLPPNPEASMAAVARLRRFARENFVKLPPGETIEELIASGRRY